jgi:hypothetical protein
MQCFNFGETGRQDNKPVVTFLSPHGADFRGMFGLEQFSGQKRGALIFRNSLKFDTLANLFSVNIPKVE